MTSSPPEGFRMKLRSTFLLTLTLCFISYLSAMEDVKTSPPPPSSTWWTDLRRPTQPQYGDTPVNITGRVGHSVMLPCTVLHLGDRSVTWMRQRDLHILTAGIFTYSADERFRVLHPENSNNWTLEIRFATLRDAGVYECHVNSDPKISRQVNLVVTDKQLDDPTMFGGTATTEPAPVVVIEGPPERHIQAGSVLSITCLVLHPIRHGPAHVLWYHGTENLDYDSPRGGVSIQTEKFPRKTRSQVMVSNVRDTDSGEYTCSPADLPPDVITVHVQHAGQHYAAVQQGGLSGAPVPHPVTHLLLLLLVLMFSRPR